MALANPRPDLTAYERATRSELTTLITELAGMLGPRLVAYMAGVGETRAVREWAEGRREPRDPIPSRLRLAYRVAHLIGEHDSPEVARAWFQGLNPQLDDQSPARLIREQAIEEVGPDVVAAARAFVVGG
jgi:hypothetical protein